MIYSVLTTETLSVNVTVTNAAGMTIMKSSYSGLFRLKITIGITIFLFYRYPGFGLSKYNNKLSMFNHFLFDRNYKRSTTINS